MHRELSAIRLSASWQFTGAAAGKSAAAAANASSGNRTGYQRLGLDQAASNAVRHSHRALLATRGASAAIFLITACAFCRPAGAAQPAYTVSQKRKRGPDGETLGEWAKKLALKFKRDCDEGGGQLYGGNLTEALRVEGFPYSSSASVFKAHRDLQRVAGSTARPPAKPTSHSAVRQPR